MPILSSETLFLEQIDSPELLENLNNWVKQFPHGGILAFVAENNSEDIERLQKSVNEIPYPLVGAVFPELIVGGELKKEGILLIRFQKMPNHYISHSASEIKSKMNDIAECLDIDVDMGDGEQALFMIFDSMIPNVATIIDDVYLQIGDTVNYMGVNAGSETFQPINCLFDNNQFIDDAVLIMLIPQHSGAIVEHGYTKPDTTISATSATGNCIKSIDWRPAFEVYKELAKMHYDVEINEENFYENAVHFPFGIMRMDGEMLVRIPVALNDDGSIFCVGEVPENAVLTLLKAVSPDSSKTVDTLVEYIKNQPETTILTFYCAGRRMHLGDASSHELALLTNKLKKNNIVGALSLGEIGGSKQGGYPLFHNAALISIPWKQNE